MRVSAKSEGLFEVVCESDGTAMALIFMQLCREWPELRRWLWREFATSEKVRNHFAQILEKGPEPTTGSHWIAEFSGEAGPWRIERQRLIKSLDPQMLRPFGGRSYAEIVKLIRQHQAGTLDLGAFMLAREWLNAKGKAKNSWRLMRAAGEFINEVVSGKTHLLVHFEKSLQQVALYQNKARRRQTLGHANWWKLQLLLYIFRSPRPAYSMRDLHLYLTSIGLRINIVDIRRFCRANGIKRDTRGGRPQRPRSLNRELKSNPGQE